MPFDLLPDAKLYVWSGKVNIGTTKFKGCNIRFLKLESNAEHKWYQDAEPLLAFANPASPCLPLWQSLLWQRPSTKASRQHQWTVIVPWPTLICAHASFATRPFASAPCASTWGSTFCNERLLRGKKSSPLPRPVVSVVVAKGVR